MTDEILALSLTCTQCGQTVKNSAPEVKDAFQFMEALRAQHWFISEQHWNQTHKCDKCASS